MQIISNEQYDAIIRLLGGFIASYEGSSVCVLHNATTEPITVDLAQVADLPLKEICAAIGMGEAKLEGTSLTVDGQTSVVLR